MQIFSGQCWQLTPQYSHSSRLQLVHSACTADWRSQMRHFRSGFFSIQLGHYQKKSFGFIFFVKIINEDKGVLHYERQSRTRQRRVDGRVASTPAGRRPVADGCFWPPWTACWWFCLKASFCYIVGSFVVIWISVPL